MGFKERIKKSEITKDLFINYCELMSLEYAYSGYEELKQSNKFKEMIQKIDSVTAQRIKYFPDLIFADGEGWLIEIKNSTYIEKSAFETYKDLKSIGYNVAIVNIYFGQLIFMDISDLKLKTIENIKIPHDQCWIYPRKLSQEEYFNWKNNHKGSETSYGIIDFNESNFIILIENINNWNQYGNK